MALAALLAVTPLPAGGSSWTQRGGPNRDFTIDAETGKTLWKHDYAAPYHDSRTQ